METIRIIHHHEDEGWWFESPDLPGLFGAADSYEEAHRLAEESVRFDIACEPEEHDEIAGRAVEHFVPSAARAFAGA